MDSKKARIRLLDLPYLISQAATRKDFIEVGLLKAEQKDLKKRFPQLADVGCGFEFFEKIFGDTIC